jgi:hypothetical protein
MQNADRTAGNRSIEWHAQLERLDIRMGMHKMRQDAQDQIAARRIAEEFYLAWGSAKRVESVPEQLYRLCQLSKIQAHVCEIIL